MREQCFPTVVPRTVKCPLATSPTMISPFRVCCCVRWLFILFPWIAGLCMVVWSVRKCSMQFAWFAIVLEVWSPWAMGRYWLCLFWDDCRFKVIHLFSIVLAVWPRLAASICIVLLICFGFSVTRFLFVSAAGSQIIAMFMFCCWCCMHVHVFWLV